MRALLLFTAAALSLSVAASGYAQSRPDAIRTPHVDPTAPGTTLGTGPARGSDDNAPKPVPGPGTTTGDSSEGVSGSAPSVSTGTSTGSAPPFSSDRTPDMQQVPQSPGHGGSSASGIGGGSIAPGRESGENAPAGRTDTDPPR
jgi:hypothetical protein